MKVSSKINYKYGYQGKFAEKEAATGLNNFQLRSYDSRVGRFTTIDPFNQYHSPFVGMGNNPINLVDPSGGKASGMSGADREYQAYQNSKEYVNSTQMLGFGMYDDNGYVGGGSAQTSRDGRRIGMYNNGGADVFAVGEIGQGLENAKLFNSNNYTWYGFKHDLNGDFNKLSDGRIHKVLKDKYGNVIFSNRWDNSINPEKKSLSMYIGRLFSGENEDEFINWVWDESTNERKEIMAWYVTDANNKKYIYVEPYYNSTFGTCTRKLSKDFWAINKFNVKANFHTHLTSDGPNADINLFYGGKTSFIGLVMNNYTIIEYKFGEHNPLKWDYHLKEGHSYRFW